LHLVASKHRPTPQQIVAVEAETSSSALKKGKLFCALELHQPTSALKLIIARGIFLDEAISSSFHGFPTSPEPLCSQYLTRRAEEFVACTIII
jgi:hypothetical protein